MRKVLAMAVLAALAGCGGKDSGKPVGPSKAAFALTGSAGPVEVLNGQTVRSPVEVHWKSEPAVEVTLSATVEPAGQGVTATVEPATLPSGERMAQVVIRCAETARSGEYKVIVTARAE
jgi:hypothetical protein